MAESPSKQVRNFLTVIGSGVVAGLLLVLALVNFYGPSDTYIAGNVLLSPEVLKSNVFGFEEIEFLFYDTASGQWKSKKIPPSVYATFYQLVSKDRSVSGSDEQSAPARLLIRAQKETFQQIEFTADGNNFRAQLKDAAEGREWAFFAHEGILQKIKSLFGEP